MSEDVPSNLAGFGPGSVLAGYRLEAQVGAGGMAVVFRARDERLGRAVALKILAPGLASDPAFRRRFIAESRAAATVDDPHIIPVYEAGESAGVLFIAMRFVPGGDLRMVLEREGPLPPERAAEFISPVASALDAAHRAGLVHRDVKPANILVDTSADRPDHVYLSDFGVSKGAVSSIGFTAAGQFLGTPDYSAPEQIQGRAVDGRVDQYALACVAYQLLTGAAPFERDQGMAVLLAHLTEPPPSLGGALPGTVDGVLARAMAKAPEKRYRSCREFADALRDALGLAPYRSHGTAPTPGPTVPLVSSPLPEAAGPGNGKADVAAGLAESGTMEAAVAAEQPAPATERAAVAGEQAAPASAKVAVAGEEAAPETVDWLPDRGPVRTADLPAAGPSTGDHDNRTEPGSHAATAVDHRTDPVTQAAAAVDDRIGPGSSGRSAGPGVVTWIGRHRRPAIALAGAVVSVAVIVPLVLASSSSSENSISNSPVVTLTDPTTAGSVASVAFNSSGTTLATSYGTSSVYLWNSATGSLTATLTDPHGQGLYSLALSPNGTMLAVGDRQGSIDLWDVTTHRLIATLTNPNGTSINSIAFSPNGMTLAASDEVGNTHVWNIATHGLTATLSYLVLVSATSVAFSPDSTTLAVGDASGDVSLWNADGSAQMAALSDPNGSGISSVAFGPGGTMVAAGANNGSIYIWDAASNERIATLTDPNSRGVNSIAFSSDGATLAVGDDDGSIFLWNVASHTLTATLTDPNSGGVTSVAVSPNGRTLASGDHDGSTFLWHI